MKFNEFESHKEAYVEKIEDQIKKTARYAIGGGFTPTAVSTADEVIAWIKPHLPADGKTRIRVHDSLRTIDQGKMHVWEKFDEENILAWCNEQTIEGAARELYRRDCRDFDLAPRE